LCYAPGRISRRDEASAISEDTAALVAAQLTQAWAVRAGVKASPQRPIEADIVEMYLRLRGAVAEVDIKPNVFDQM